MNISVDRLESNDGSGLDDRPAYVADALSMRERVGYRDGKPLVPHPDGKDDELQIGDDVNEAYSHYNGRRGDNLLLPSSGAFLERLAEHPKVEDVSDISSELQTDENTVEKALDLHGVSTPLESAAGDGTEDADGITLPSGETVPFDPLHPLVLAQLLSDGLSFSEMSLYLSREVGEKVSERDIRDAAERILDGGTDDSPETVHPRKTVEGSAAEVASTPWG